MAGYIIRQFNNGKKNDPTIHLRACKERNISKKYPIDMGCNMNISQIQHQVSWNKLPKNFYFGKNGNMTTSMNCSDGFRKRPKKNTCPTGYTFKAIRNTNRGCRTYFKKCTKKPIYDFTYTYHSVNPNNIDNQDHEQLTYELPSTGKAINNISHIENGESHKYKIEDTQRNNSSIQSGINCIECRKYCSSTNQENMNNAFGFKNLKKFTNNSIDKVKSLYR